MNYQIFPPPTPERYASIKKSIEEVGLLYSIVLDQDRNVIDGRTRKQICDELGIECRWDMKPFESEAQKFEYSLRMNCERRQLNSQQKRDVVRTYIKLDPELASSALANITGISDKTITKIRQELVATSEIPKLEKFRGLDGKQRRLPSIIANTAKEAEQASKVIGDLPSNCDGKTFDVLSATKKTTKREPLDEYLTPIKAVEEILDRETFDGQVWECACGDGRIVEACQKRGIDCYGTDIQSGDDFLEMNNVVPNIMTNPPFGLANKFVEHALKLATEKVAMLLRINFLAGCWRYGHIYAQHPPARVYVFSKRVPFENHRGADDFMWIVWDRSHKGPTELQHIPPKG